MMVTFTAFCVILAVICLALLTSNSKVQAAGDVEAGKAVYAKKCKTCHAGAGEGNPAMAKMLKVEIKHLGSKDIQQKKDDDIAKAIAEGVGKMKPVKDLSPADLANVIAFTRSLKQ
jgi:mono/diheme cytochrome c family protein